MWVYGRGGEPCRRCGTTIRTDNSGDRITFWCPNCQPGMSGPFQSLRRPRRILVSGILAAIPLRRLGCNPLMLHTTGYRTP